MSLAAKVAWNFESITRDASLRLPSRARSNTRADVVVSLTTYPARIGTVWKTLETIYRQSVLPAYVVLVLSIDQFPDRVLPTSVTHYMSEGLRPLFVDGNIGSYKKLIPLMAERPGVPIVTADDDVLYPRNWLRDLVSVHRRNSRSIVGYRGTVITGGRDNLDPYANWPQASTKSASSRVFLTGMGGILYPPGSLGDDHILDMDLAMRLAPTADDIWFKAMSLLANTTVSKVSDKKGDFSTIRSAQKTALRQVNVSRGQNDIQFKAVMEHFDLWERLERND